MKNYDLVIFDVDGTLLDTSEGILSAVKYTLEKSSFTLPSEEVFRTFIGPPIKESFLKNYNIDEEMANKMTKIFRDRYKDSDILKAKPYEGIIDVFEEIKLLGMECAVATYKRQDYAEKIVKHFGFGKYTNIIFGADNDNKLKKKDIIEKCITVAGIKDLKRVIMIGDSDNDAIGAKHIGIDFLGVTYGFGFRDKEEIYANGAVYSAENPYEIKKFLERG